MKKLDKILMLLNLFYTRKRVSMESIRRVCEIPERTAYRYLNTLSEANIPIYYDRESRAYQLNRQDDVELGNLDINEQVLMVLALRVLGSTLPDAYQEALTQLSRKVFSRLSLPMEEVWHAMDKTVRADELDREQVHRLATTALILAAIQANRPIRLLRSEDDDGDKWHTVEKPSIQFGDGWCLIDRNSDGRPSAVALESIATVTIE